MAIAEILTRTTVKACLLLVGLGAAAVGAGDAKAQLRPATLRMDWTPAGYHAPLFLALNKGYYKDEGIDLQIFDGKGSLSTLTAISEGTDTIGIASLATMSLAVSQGRPLMAIGGMIQTLPDSIISLKGSGITTPKDVEGKTWGYNPEDYATRLFPMYAAAAGIDESKIKKVQLSYSIVVTSLLQGKIDFMIGWESTTGLNVERRKPIEKPILYSASGINMLGGGFFVTRKTTEEKADVLRGFMAATTRAFEEAKKAPDAAVDAMIAYRPGLDRALMISQLIHTTPFFETKYSAGKEFGYMAAEDWAQTLSLMKRAFEFKSDVNAADIYTNGFLPKKN